MELSDIIAPDAVFANLKASSKKQLLQDLASQASSRTNLPERKIFDALLERERLGSTGVGHGVAIPHGKFVGLPRITGLFARMAKPVAFDAVDDMPVDIICLLLAPEGSGAEHLKALSRIARLLRSEEKLSRIRALTDSGMLYSELTTPLQADAA